LTYYHQKRHRNAAAEAREFSIARTSGLFSYGWKIPLLPNVIQDCTEGRKEGKWGMPCLRSNEGIVRTHPDKKPVLLKKEDMFLLCFPEPKSSTFSSQS